MSTTYPEFTASKTHVADIKVSGSLGGEVTQMTISAAGAAHIMNVLTNLYSDPNLAVLREISSNGLDSHKVAGNDAPILVSLPTHLSPVFIVQDFGTGMSKDTLQDVYASYGASTKGSDLDTIGAFGLGAKSVLTLAAQSTIVSVHDGIRHTAVISRGDNGIGSMEIVSSIPTTDANGVTVKVPVSDVSAFNRNVKSFFSTWKKGTVLVDGTAPWSIWDADFSQMKNGHTHLAVASGESGWTIVMGGIAYRVDLSNIGVSAYGYSTKPSEVVAKILRDRLTAITEVPIGSIDLTPSREAIRFTERTKSFVSALYEQIVDGIPTYITEQISLAKTRSEALLAAHAFKGMRAAFSHTSGTKYDDITWNGEELPRFLGDTTVKDDDETGFRIERLSVQRAYRNDSRRAFTVSKISNSRESFVPFPDPSYTNYYIVAPTTDWPSIVRNLSFYMEAKSLTQSATNYYLFSEALDDKWVTENVLFSEIKADSVMAEAKIIRAKERAEAKANGESSRGVQLYPVFTVPADADDPVKFENIDLRTLTGEVLYIQQSTNNTPIRSADVGRTISKTFVKSLISAGVAAGTPVVFLSNRRSWTAATRRFKNGVTYRTTSEVLQEAAEKRSRALSDTDKAYAGIYAGQYEWESRAVLRSIISLSKIINDLDQSSPFVTLYNQAVKAENTYSSAVNGGYAEALTVDRPLYDSAVSAIKVVSALYPLINLTGSYHRGNPSHLATYITLVDSGRFA